jgi:hypothetical protein
LSDDLLNAKNRGIQSNNSSGIVGVFHRRIPWRNGLGYSEYWVAKWVDPYTRKGVSKTFSVAKLGYEKAKEFAVKFRVEMLERLNELGEGYSERHVANSKPSCGFDLEPNCQPCQDAA